VYKRKISEEEADAIKRGDTRVLSKILKDVDKVLVKELKSQKGDVRFQQGASHIVDSILELINAP
jgi:hypothetical protein